MRRCVWLGVGLSLAGCGSAQVVATPVRETGVAASCVGLSPAAQFASARLVFVGVMLPGPAAGRRGRRVLGSPARMRVTRYLKGHGPPTVKVDTAITIESDAEGIAEDGIEPQAGERWKIYATSRRQPFETSICAGSRRIVPPSPPARALRLWRTFPVEAVPRPIVPLGARVLISAADGGAVEVTRRR